MSYQSRKTLGFTHAKDLHPFVIAVFESASADKSALGYVAVSSGPGSYTGLRIGVSEAKGLCMSLDAKLIDLPTLEWMHDYWHKNAPEFNAYCMVADAGRSELYARVVTLSGEIIQPLHSRIVDQEWVEGLPEGTLIAGEGAKKIEPWNQGNHFMVDDYFPDARDMGIAALQRITNEQFEDPIFFEPHYLKDFVPGKPKNLKLL
jgi:tRNA threonylcarbamoyladenosine biosynthesis protein TsaB